MGPKLFAAFGAGALVAASVMFFANRPAQVAPPAPPPAAVTPVAPPVIPSVVPQPTAVAKPLKVRPTRRAKKYVTASIAKPDAPQSAPVPVYDAALPDIAISTETPSLAAIDPALPPREPITVTFPEGTLLQVRLGERLASDRHVTGDTFVATLDAPLVSEGWVIAERGARLLGRVVNVDEAGRIEGIAQMTLELASLTTADGQKIELRTARFVRKGEATRKSDVAKVGATAAIGAIIGAIAGGGKGAAIGAASGGAAGGAVVLGTRGKAAVLEAETRLSFRLDRALTITERR